MTKVAQGTKKSLTAKEIVEMNKEYTFYSWSVQGQTNPIPVVKADGVYFWDADGKRYLDFASQLVNTNVGHQNPKVVKAIQDQAAQLNFCRAGDGNGAARFVGQKIGRRSRPVI